MIDVIIYGNRFRLTIRQDGSCIIHLWHPYSDSTAQGYEELLYIVSSLKDRDATQVKAFRWVLKHAKEFLPYVY